MVRLGEGPLGPDGSTSTSTVAPTGADGGVCPAGQVSADEVLWIGDSWILNPGTQTTRVRDLAREAGAIGPTEDYVNHAAAGATMSAIASQYSAQESGQTKVKVLIMDGGGWDLFLANGSTTAVASVTSSFQQLLATIANDGTVQHILYFLVPDSASPGVAQLRQGMQQACAGSTVPCSFLDLQPIWANHPEYSAGIFATDAGGVALGDAIWALMQQNCIAQ
jgi:hypothetical protein